MLRRITLRNLDRPARRSIDEDRDWLVEALSLKNGRDIQQTTNRIFRELLELVANREIVSCEELAHRLNLKQGCVNHHMRQLTEAGLVHRERGRIRLRGGSVKRSIEEMKKDTDRIFDELLRVSEEMDHDLGLSNRY